MKKLTLIFIILSLLLGFLCYLSTLKILYSCIVSILFLVDYLFLLRKKFVNYNSAIERIHTAYHFINSFIITMSVKDSFEDAYQNAIRISNPKFAIITNGIKEMLPIDRTKYLKDYFNLAIYKMFLNLLNLYQDQGGNILNMSDNLIRECTRTEKILSETLSIGYKHLMEFIILWIMSLGILIFMRVSISDFYLKMLNNNLVPLLIFFFFVICILSIHLFLAAFTNLRIKEDANSCKN